MRIGVTIGGESIGVPGTPAELVGQACAAEADGFPAAWSVHFSRGVDALSVLAVAGSRTSRIDLGVGVVPSYPRHPLALAQQAPRVIAAAPVAVCNPASGREAAAEVFARYADVGVTELWATAFPVGPGADASVRRTRTLLAGGV